MNLTWKEEENTTNPCETFTRNPSFVDASIFSINFIFPSVWFKKRVSKRDEMTATSTAATDF